MERKKNTAEADTLEKLRRGLWFAGCGSSQLMQEHVCVIALIVAGRRNVNEWASTVKVVTRRRGKVLNGGRES